MQYGFFDNSAMEYVITNAKTPAPWVNYLGSPAYGAILSNNGGGYSFRKSGAAGRILRYHFNADDTPGRYVYLKNEQTGELRLLTRFPDICRHGTGYSVMETAAFGVKTEITFYVPDGAEHEVWAIRLENASEAPVSLSLTGYAEFTNNGHYEQDTVNLQYSQFISKTVFRGDRIRQMIHANLEGVASGGDGMVERTFALAGLPVESYSGDREVFLGAWGGYERPEALENESLSNETCFGGNPCGALMTKLTLAPGASAFAAFLLGEKTDEEAAKLTKAYARTEETVGNELKTLKDRWHGLLGGCAVRTPDEAFNTMVNVWNPYNCMITFTWSRAASLFYCGLRNGYGYRDTVQDIRGIIHLDPAAARERIVFMLSAQAKNGGGLPLVRFTHCPGYEDTPDDESYRRETGHPAWRADDALWLFQTVAHYISETGDTAFLDENVPYADSGADTVYNHLKGAIRFSFERKAKHGLPAGLHADWNDCLRLGADGESVFVAMQYLLALEIMKGYVEKKGDGAYEAWLTEEAAGIRKVLNGECFEGDRYVRGFTEAGETIGTKSAPEASLWLNPQSWAVISGAADEETGKRVLDSVYDTLNTPNGAMLMLPPFKKHAFEGALAVCYHGGMKENASVFAQTQGWLILAEALLGRGERAFMYYKENCPAAQNAEAEKRVMEPYVYGQFTEGAMSPHAGRSHVHWLTGTASTMMVASLEGILGFRPDADGLLLSPAIPPEWSGFELTKRYRGKKMRVIVKDPNHAGGGFRSMTVNGEKYDRPYIPADALKEENEVVLTLS